MSKSNLLILPIIQYVTCKVSQAGETPQLLPGEPDLCEKFGVARGTVRRAMAYLIERGIVIQLPKRRGYFSNPKYSNSGEINIGVLSGSGYFAAMSHLASDMYSGFLQGIKPLSSAPASFRFKDRCHLPCPQKWEHSLGEAISNSVSLNVNVLDPLPP